MKNMSIFLFMRRMDRNGMLKIFHSRFLLFLQEAIDRDGQKAWTNRKIAETLGLSENAVSSLKGGTSLPSLETLYNICELFGGTADQFLGREYFRLSSGRKPTPISGGNADKKRKTM